MGDLSLKITNPAKHLREMPDFQSHFNTQDKKRVAEAAKEFESLLTSMMLKSMTKTTDGLFGSEGFGGDYFDTMFETQMASYMSRHNSMGMADLIYKRITGEDINKLQLDKIKDEFKINTDKPASGTASETKLSPSQGSLKRLNKYDGFINEASKRFGINENLIKSVILTESAGHPKAISKADAKGLMQLIDPTAADMGVKNVWDPKENIFGGSKYLSKMLNQHGGDMDLALAAYNAGPGAVKKFNGIPPFTETKNYINRVKSYLNYLEG